MNACNGKPAELCALPYLEGALPEAEAERFEEHYFECPACLAYLQNLQAASRGLERLPATPGEQRGMTLLGWPAMNWAMAVAAAILLLAAGVSYRALHSGLKAPQVAQVTPVPAPQAKPSPRPATAPVPRINPSQLADLSLPAFAAPTLRGASEDRQFESGMEAYKRGDCHDALADLSKVPSQSTDARAAEFYCAACEMHLGDLKAAAAGMHSVEDAGDSPQQESALYYEAQIALANNDLAAAHRYLIQTIALQGDLERDARNEDRKVRELANESADEGAEKPESGSQ